MSRPLRIQYPNAWYHVMNRGRRGDVVFLDEKDYLEFINLLKETSDMWRVRIGAYCLMPTHYHLLIQTPEANLSRCMRHVDGVYTQRFNRQHNYDGQLFRGRYKSILVGGDSYLLELVRYIHRNPLRGGLVKRLDSYFWSSHEGYLSSAKKWDWLHKEYFISLFSDDKVRKRTAYINFVSKEEPEKIKQFFTLKNIPSILGSEGFINWVKEKYYKVKSHGEVPESKALAPGADKIKDAVCNAYGVEVDGLMVTRRRIANEPRNVAIYLVRRYTGATLESIGREFNMKKYSSVGSVIERMRMQILKDKRLRKRIAELEKKLIMSQEQI
jgi:REP element-mobilizing transposase RayT